MKRYIRLGEEGDKLGEENIILIVSESKDK